MNSKSTFVTTCIGNIGNADLMTLVASSGDSLSNSNEDNSMEKLADGSVFRSEYVRSAANICRFLLQSPAYLRMVGKETDLDRELQRRAPVAVSVAEYADVAIKTDCRRPRV